MHLSRPNPAPRLISLVSMIDVLLIMLVFFMVTSTYLNLDMIPMAQRADEAASATLKTPPGIPQMIRLAPNGQATLQGRPVPLDDIANLITGNSVLILPSPRADTQALVALMDALSQSGITQIRLLQLGNAP